MSFGACKGSQRPVKWSFALHSHRCSLVVLLWIHCNICTNLRRRNHCCRDELCSGSCAEPQPSMEPRQSPQMEACSVQRRALRTEDYICESFLILQWGDCVREGSCFFPVTLLRERWAAKSPMKSCMGLLSRWTGWVLPGCGVHFHSGGWLVG